MYEIGDRTSFGTVIFVSEGQSMVSSWTDYIFVNKRKDGRFSLKGYKWLESYRAPFHYVWQRIDSVIGIKGGQEFLKALSRIEGSLSVDVGMDDVLRVVTDLDPITGASIGALYEE
ncbi:MAG: hypothetical protein O2949_11110 [Proteobacteria bacterium]|nr:hypothetical protein [Pseudomonadota bacterium]